MRTSAFTALPFERWPAMDQVLWVRGTTAGDPLDEPATGANWRPATKTIVMSGYAIALVRKAWSIGRDAGAPYALDARATALVHC